MRTLASTTLLFLALGTAVPSAHAGSWGYVSLDPTTYSGNSLRLRLNAQGLRRYAWWTSTEGIIVAGDGWVREVLPGPYEPLEANHSRDATDPEAGGARAAQPASAQLLITNSVDLALGPDDTPWVAHIRIDCFGNCTGTTRVSHRTASGWTTEDLDVGRSRPAIEVGADGRVHVITVSTSNQIRYWVRDAGGVWTSEPLGDGFVQAALQLDASGTPHVAWADGQRVWHGVRGSGGWQMQVADSGAFYSASLALSSSGEGRLAYMSNANTPAKGIWYAEQAAAGWSHVLVVPGITSAGLALAIDPAGDPFLAYNDQSGLDLRGASRKHGTWSLEDIDTYGNTGYWPSVAFDPAGRPLVAYQADYAVGTALAVGAAVAGVAPPISASAFAIRALGGIARSGSPLALEVTSPSAATITLSLVDVAGRTLASLPARELSAGASRLAWNVGSLQPGVCFVRARTSTGVTATTRLSVLR